MVATESDAWATRRLVSGITVRRGGVRHAEDNDVVAEEKNVTETRAADASQIDVGRALKHGAVGGIIAGLIFPMFEMAMAAAQGQNPLGPLRMIGGIALGEQALDPTFSILVAGAAGMVVHMMLSVVYGLAFGAAAAVIPAIVSSIAGAALAGAALGTVL